MSNRPQRAEQQAADHELPGVAKVAAVLVALNKELASRVLKFFDEDEVKVIAQAVHDLGSVSRQALDGLVEEFASAIKGGIDFTANTKKIQVLLEGVLTPDQIEALLAQTGTSSSGTIWQQLAKMPETAIGQYLQKEHPQVIAYVLSRTEPQTSAILLSLFPRARANDIVARMLSLRPVNERSQALLEISFVQDVLLNRRGDSDLSPHARLAGIINKMDRKLIDQCLQSIAEHNDKDAELIKQQLFTFEDLDRLAPPSLVAVFDTIQPDIVIKALAGMARPLMEKILQAIPARARRGIQVELESGPASRPREVIKARRVIADLALQMLERGTIEIEDGAADTAE